ncbi:MAG: carboxy terminal-processing peptidase [Kiritimatiellae bacterium]|nr:carboxy terminal-processing peptidase [Kiritimatiellia bacterium]
MTKRLMIRQFALLFAVFVVLLVSCAKTEEKPHLAKTTKLEQKPVPPPPTVLTPEEHYALICKRFARQFPAEHLSRTLIDDTISRQAWTNYLNALDFEHMYFLQSDVDRFADSKLNLDDAIKDGNLLFAYNVFEVFKQRVQASSVHIDKLLANGFDLKKHEAYAWQRKNAPWPQDQAEWNDLWRKKIKNEYIRQVVAQKIETKKTEEEKKPDKPIITPEDFIQKRYKQLRSLFTDSGAEWVLQKYLTAFAQAYDPHSSYMSPSSVADFDIEMKLSLVGIGALLRSEDGTAKIVRLIPGGPASKDTREKKLCSGDKIIAVGQDNEPAVDILHWPLYKIVKLIRGKKNSRVVLTVISASDPTGSTTKTVDLIRGEVRLEEQTAKLKVREFSTEGDVKRKLAIINVPAFYANLRVRNVRDPNFKSSAHDVAKLLREMRPKKVEGLVLDLRSNGGGSLLEAIRMVGLFIADGPTVQVKEKFPPTRILDDPDPYVHYAGPLIILVNKLSASASEIVAGALKDYGRAIIVGDTKTHGKGTVQTIIKVGRDKKYGSTKITSATYYRVSGGSTQLAGVASDIVVPSPWEYMEVGEDTLSNPLPWNSVQKASYEHCADLSACIPVLRKQSEARRAASPKYAAYAKLLERIQAINKTKKLSLNIIERTKMASAEKDLRELQKTLTPDDDEKETEDKQKTVDIVMDEALSILLDFIVITKKQPELVGYIGPGRSHRRSLRGWIEDVL